jgi:putative transposase
MTRTRHISPGQPLHITQRGVDRCPTFIVDDDFAFYLWVLHASTEEARCAVHAYVLMTNHVHLLISPIDATGPARLMRAIGTRYVRYFNDRYRRTGTLWEGRFRSTVVDTDAYFFACSRYIERNPQRAGLTDDPATYMWSSFRCNANGEADRIITPHPLYTALGADTATRARTYRRLFAIESSPAVVAAVRTASRARRAWPDTSYQQAVAAVLGDSTGRAGGGGWPCAQ